MRDFNGYQLADGRDYVKASRDGSAVWFVSKHDGAVYLAKSWKHVGRQLSPSKAAEVLELLGLVLVPS